MDDTWTERELPVLTALVEHFDDSDAAQWHRSDVVGATGLDADSVARALAALHGAQPPYVAGVSVEEASYPVVLTGVTERARRAVGAWPTPEALVDRLVAALLAAADDEGDPDQRSRLRQAAGWLGGSLRDVATQVATGVVLHQTGM